MAGRRNNRRARGRTETPDELVSRVVKGFRHWLDDHPSPVLPADELLVDITGLAHLKSTIGVSNPADWPAEAIEEVFELLAQEPRIDPTGRLGRDGFAALSVFFDFLTSTGRWKPHNDERASRAALDRAARMVPATDPDALVTRLPAEWAGRPVDDRAIGFGDGFGESGDGSDDTRGDEGGDEGELDPERLADAATEFAHAAGLRPGEVIVVPVPPADREWAALSATPLLHHLRSVLAWIGPGRRLDEPDMLAGDDLTWWIGHHQLPVPDGGGRDRIEALALVHVWHAAQQSGVVTVRGGQASRGPQADLLDGPASTAAIQLARELIDRVISAVMGRWADPEAIDIALHAATLAVVVALCRPAGYRTDALPADPRRTDPEQWDSGEQVERVMVGILVFDNLATLQSLGLLPELRGRASIPEGLRPAVVASIDAPSAPFRLDPAPGAVPVADPVG